MAAHLKTGLEQTLASIEKGNLSKTVIRGTVDFDCWTSDDMMIAPSGQDVWGYLFSWVEGDLTTAELEPIIRHRLKAATKEWERLGKPETREEWYRKLKEESNERLA